MTQRSTRLAFALASACCALGFCHPSTKLNPLTGFGKKSPGNVYRCYRVDGDLRGYGEVCMVVLLGCPLIQGLPKEPEPVPCPGIDREADPLSKLDQL